MGQLSPPVNRYCLSFSVSCKSMAEVSNWPEIGDADHPKFEALVDLIKGEAENTRKALAALL